MKVWLLEPLDPMGGPWEPKWDCAYGWIVRAPDEASARALIDDEDVGCEGLEVWSDPAWTSCVELTGEGEAAVIMRNFLHG